MDAELTSGVVGAGGLVDGACRWVVLADLNCNASRGWSLGLVDVVVVTFLRRIVCCVAMVVVGLELWGAGWLLLVLASGHREVGGGVDIHGKSRVEGVVLLFVECCLLDCVVVSGGVGSG